MKIAIMSNGRSLDSMMGDSFARSPYIIIYDTEEKKYSAVDNVAFQSNDGAGPKAAEFIIKNDIDVLLTIEIGMKAYSVLAKENIKIQLSTSCTTVGVALKKFLLKK